MSDPDYKEPAVYTYQCSNEHCGVELTEFNVILCEDCDRAFCLSCAQWEMKICANCGRVACCDCLEFDDEIGDWFCNSECKEEYADGKV